MATTTTLSISAGTMPSATVNSSASCANEVIPDYNVLRQQNLEKINNYYNQLLSSYTTNYREYTSQSASSNVNDRLYANTTLKPKVENYNQQLINTAQQMISSVNQDMDLISSQRDELTKKASIIDTTMNNITMLKDKDNEMRVLTKAREDSLNTTTTGTDDMAFSTYIHIGLNILMLLIIVGFVFYLVYSSYSFGGRNNNARNTVYVGGNKSK